MEVYTNTYHLTNKDVNMHRNLRLQRLFEIIQDNTIRHTTKLGAGRDKTLDKGLLWVVVQQYAKIYRIPQYDEHITIESWPGETMHILFPRYFRFKDEEGNVIIEGSAIWTIINQEDRKVIFPEKYGITIPTSHKEKNIPLPKPIKSHDITNNYELTIPFSYCDLNGHMSNTYYFTLLDDYTPITRTNQPIHEITTQYSKEVHLDETIKISTDNTSYLQGSKNDNVYFKILIK